MNWILNMKIIRMKFLNLKLNTHYMAINKGENLKVFTNILNMLIPSKSTLGRMFLRILLFQMV